MCNQPIMQTTSHTELDGFHTEILFIFCLSFSNLFLLIKLCVLEPKKNQFLVYIDYLPNRIDSKFK